MFQNRVSKLLMSIGAKATGYFLFFSFGFGGGGGEGQGLFSVSFLIFQMLQFNDSFIGIYKDKKENEQNHLKWNIHVAYGNIPGIPLA